jgi:hypothetical protein
MPADKHNGASAKMHVTKDGSVRVRLPRDRDGIAELAFISKHERHFAGFDCRIPVKKGPNFPPYSSYCLRQARATI